MRILLVRHGESEGNIDERAYVTKGDHKVELTKEGWEQAVSTGRFLKEFYSQRDVSDWPCIFVSSYLRTQQTLRGVLHGIDGIFTGDPALKEEIRLTEKFFGARNHLAFSDLVPNLDPDFAKNFKRLSSATYRSDPFKAPNILGESSLDSYQQVSNFLDGTFSRDKAEGKNDFLIVTHGATIQSFLMRWAHLPMNAKKEIKNPNNASVISIEGKSKDWTIRTIYNGKTREAVCEPIIDHIPLLCKEKLPPLPDFLRDELK